MPDYPLDYPIVTLACGVGAGGGLLRTAAGIERCLWLPQTTGADLPDGGHMEREKLEREIHQLAQIIAADVFALASKSTPIADRAGLRRQIEIRTAL